VDAVGFGDVMSCKHKKPVAPCGEIKNRGPTPPAGIIAAGRTLKTSVIFYRLVCIPVSPEYLRLLDYIMLRKFVNSSKCQFSGLLDRFCRPNMQLSAINTDFGDG
jgi:hypothetical protein